MPSWWLEIDLEKLGLGGGAICVQGGLWSRQRLSLWEVSYSEARRRTVCNCGLIGAREAFVEVMNAGNGLKRGAVRAGVLP